MRILRVAGAIIGLALVTGGLVLIAMSLGWIGMPSGWQKETPSSLILAGATLMLVGFGVFAWLANAELASATEHLAQYTEKLAEQGEQERAQRRARLDLAFDESNPALWWHERRWVRVMVTNAGPGPATNVVTVLEKIEPAQHNPLLGLVASTGEHGINVLPSRLDRKAEAHLPPRCDINRNDREYFDVLTFHQDVGNPEVAFQIAEKEELASHVLTKASAMWFPIVWGIEYSLFIRVTAANAEPVERVFKFRAMQTQPWFHFWQA